MKSQNASAKWHEKESSSLAICPWFRLITPVPDESAIVDAASPCDGRQHGQSDLLVRNNEWGLQASGSSTWPKLFARELGLIQSGLTDLPANFSRPFSESD